MSRHRRWAANYNLDHFTVLNAGLTEWGQYCQAIREAWTQFTELRRQVADRGSRGGFEGWAADVKIQERVRVLTRFLEHAISLHSRFEDVTAEHAHELDIDQHVHSLLFSAGCNVLAGSGVTPTQWGIALTFPVSRREEVLSLLGDPKALASRALGSSYEPSLQSTTIELDLTDLPYLLSDVENALRTRLGPPRDGYAFPRADLVSGEA